MIDRERIPYSDLEAGEPPEVREVEVTDEVMESLRRDGLLEPSKPGKFRPVVKICQGKTKAGDLCRMRARDNGYCHLHQGQQTK
jgi:hypothetical protein